jgi:hypothetical protein
LRERSGAVAHCLHQGGTKAVETMMTKKLFLIVGFVLTLSTLGFAAANAGVSTVPDHGLVGGQVLDVSYD